MSSISNRRLSTRELTMTALFVTLITAGAFIRVPTYIRLFDWIYGWRLCGGALQ